MVMCKNCRRYFTVQHNGKTFALCDMDCFVDTLGDGIDYDLCCDYYEYMDSNDSEN